MMKECNYKRALSITQTTCINGIFVILVFLSHFCQYVDTSSLPYFQLYLFLRSHLGQLIVAPFLFYSGYGIMEQIKNKGNNYVDDIPRKRVIKTWVHFAIAVLLFLLVDFAIGKHYSLLQISLSFFAWESIGNSNWYIFTILILYIATYVGFKSFSDSKKAIATVFCLCCIYIVGMHSLKDGSWWYDTIFCYPAGMFLSYKNDDLNVFGGDIAYLFWVFACFLLVFCIYNKANLLAQELLAIVFCLDIVLICAFIRIENPIFLFLGKHAFEIYILQRIPMLLLKDRVWGYAYLLLTLIFTIVISVGFKKTERKVDLLLKL